MKSALLTVIGISVLISCGTEPTPTYQLTTSVVGNGSVSPSSGQFDEGESVTITSTPDSGWVFSNWEGDWTSSQTPATITMDRDKTIIGVFERKEYPLNITIGEGEGSVSERVVSQPKVTDYPFETVVELTPVPTNQWWVFSSWSGDITSDQQVVEVTVNGETNVTLNFGFTGTSYVYKTYEYDSNNNLIEQIIYNSDGTLSTRFVFVFDSNSNQTEYKQFLKDGTIGTWISYKYDENNNRIEQLNYESDGTIFQNRKYDYDSNNNLIKETKYRDGIKYAIRTYIYDSNNNLIERVERNGDGLLMNRIEYEYDSSDNILKRIVFSSNGSIGRREIYQYDENENLIRVDNVNGDGFGYIYLYEYDLNNSLIEEKSYSTNSTDNYLLWKNTYEYDSDDVKTKQTYYNSSNESEYFIMFEYDSNNNLIEEVRYEYQKGKIVSNRKQTDPLNELCNQLNLPEQQVPMLCEE